MNINHKYIIDDMKVDYISTMTEDTVDKIK